MHPSLTSLSSKFFFTLSLCPFSNSNFHTLKKNSEIYRVYGSGSDSFFNQLTRCRDGRSGGVQCNQCSGHIVLKFLAILHYVLQIASGSGVVGSSMIGSQFLPLLLRSFSAGGSGSSMDLLTIGGIGPVATGASDGTILFSSGPGRESLALPISVAALLHAFMDAAGFIWKSNRFS